MLEGLAGAGLIGLAAFWDRKRWKSAGDGIWRKNVRGGQLSVAPYSARTPDYHVMFYTVRAGRVGGGSIDGGRTGTTDLDEAKRRAELWFDRGMEGRA